MTQCQERFQALIIPLFKRYHAEILPAMKVELAMFRRRAVENGVPESVVDLLAEFYGVSNGIPCLNSLVFHRCDDEILFEWWDDGELWLGQRDNDVLRWADDKFCLGDASNISYSQEDEFDTLVDLLEAVLARSFGCR